MVNVVEGVARCTAWATALGAAAAPSSAPTPVADDLARSTMSSWVGALRAVAVTAAAVTDAAAIMSCPPELVECYSVDLADQLPGRVDPVTLSVEQVAWASENSSGSLPVVSIVEAQPVAAASPGGSDVITMRVRPSVAPAPLIVTVSVHVVGAPAVDPLVLDVRLSPEILDLDP